MNSIIAAVAVFLFFLVTSSPAHPLDTWTTRSQSVPAFDLTGVSFGNGVYVAVAHDQNGHSVITRSVDGLVWSNAPAPCALSTITFGDGKFVALGGWDHLVTSYDGISWELHNPIAGMSFNRITYGGGLYLATGNAGYMFVSVDGVNWQAHNPGGFSEFNDMAYGNGTYVAVGGNGTIVSSSNAVNWVLRSPGISNPLWGVTFALGRFVTVGNAGIMLTSTNGANWTQLVSGTAMDLRDVNFGGGKFIAVGEYDTIVTSEDGRTWTVRLGHPQTVWYPDTRLYEVVYGSAGFVAVGAEMSHGEICSSLDGLDWTKVFGSLDAIAYGNDRFVAVGEEGGTRVISRDATVWLAGTTGTREDLHAIAFGCGTFVAVGDNGAIYSTTNGLAWQGASVGTNHLRAVACSSIGFAVAGDSGTILFSTNGAIWENRVSGTTQPLTAITFGGGTFVAASGRGPDLILRSSDGSNWLPCTIPPKLLYGSYNSATYGNGQFAMGGFGREILGSSDAVVWDTRSPDSNRDNISGLAFGNGLFVGVTQDKNVLFSTDNRNWQMRGLDVTDSPRAVAFGNGFFVSVGQTGLIVQSRPVTHLQGRILNSSGDFEVTVSTQVGLAHRLQASTDLSSWTDLTTVTNIEEKAVFVDSTAAGYSARFYRAIDQ